MRRFIFDLNGILDSEGNQGEILVGAGFWDGDQVEIIKSKFQNPSPNWSSFVKTPKAKSRIKKFIKTKEYKEYSILGLKISIFIFAISALLSLRINSSVFPENMLPHITSIQPEFIGVSVITYLNQFLY